MKQDVFTRAQLELLKPFTEIELIASSASSRMDQNDFFLFGELHAGGSGA